MQAALRTYGVPLSQSPLGFKTQLRGDSLWIVTVDAGSAAARAGLRLGRLELCDGERVASDQDMHRLLQRARLGRRPFLELSVRCPQADDSTFDVGEIVFYEDRNAGAHHRAAVVAVDRSLEPHSYTVRLLGEEAGGVERGTEAARLLRPYTPREPGSTSPAHGALVAAWPVGSVVQAHSLQSGMLNGKRGEVVGHTEAGRVTVRFAAEGDKALRPANLRLLERPSAKLADRIYAATQSFFSEAASMAKSVGNAMDPRQPPLPASY
eukprot:TRINITY_DN29010_c0_g1_i1.p1 TRINITY_DN29010_c0_g1~~TRINITY_DN29010_c0_g1_i1.p1  ORF type:complete len:266 (+),score=57.36 TRINITY_DN29010_c0_g1_i1:58-855(+)